MNHEKYMTRCLELARLGAGSTAPNPMVGSVVVHKGKIIGEGYHRKHGEAHAEVNAINSVKHSEVLKESTIYVTLEPCSHYGLTPPCANLIIEKNIPKVVIGTIDPFARVSGRGIEKLEDAGIKVTVGVLENECQDINKRFFTYHEKKRPYIILKWAQTLDGFIDIKREKEDFGTPTWITGDLALRLVHKIRSEEDAILVGRKTAEKDNPSLTVRHWKGKNPIRIVTDQNQKLSKELNLFDGSEETLIFNAIDNKSEHNISNIKIDFTRDIIPGLLENLYNQNIQSLIVEGGKMLLESFIKANIWDEAHVFIGDKFFYNGIKAPNLKANIMASENLDSDKLVVFSNY